MNKCCDSTWLQEYEDLMFGELHSKETMAIASDIKYIHMPALLFKYRSCSKDSLEALKFNFLFSSQPKEFNDLFKGPIEIVCRDATKNIYQKTYNSLRAKNSFLPYRKVGSSKDFLESIAISFGGSYDDVKQKCKEFPIMQALGDAMDVIISNMIDKLKNEVRNRYNICCFCSEYDNVLMWAHYANNSKGFCIGYDIKSPNSDLTHFTFPVIYRNDYNLCIQDIDDINGSDCMHMLTIKSTDWSQEKEWRTFFPPNAPTHKEQMPTAKVVFLGTNTEKEHELQIHEICAQKGIKLFKMVPELLNHKLVAKSLDY